MVRPRSQPHRSRESKLPDPSTTAPTRPGRRSRVKPSCESCYFGSRMLCALDLGGPCSTFRPDSPHGLVPPNQPMLLVDAGAASAPELAAA